MGKIKKYNADEIQSFAEDHEFVPNSTKYYEVLSIDSIIEKLEVEIENMKLVIFDGRLHFDSLHNEFKKLELENSRLQIENQNQTSTLRFLEQENKSLRDEISHLKSDRVPKNILIKELNRNISFNPVSTDTGKRSEQKLIKLIQLYKDENWGI